MSSRRSAAAFWRSLAHHREDEPGYPEPPQDREQLEARLRREATRHDVLMAEAFTPCLRSIIEDEAARLGVETGLLPYLQPGDREWLRARWSEQGYRRRALKTLYQFLIAELLLADVEQIRRPH
jgi:hypothetical protein